MESPDTPPSYVPPPPPKRFDKPKITLQIPSPAVSKGPNTSTSIHWGMPKYYPGKVPTTPGSHISDPHTNPYYNPFLHMYHNKASDFMFKQFEGFKDFTMNTAKSGLSVGEKTAFWFYNKLKLLSKKWFTHFFLTLCLIVYSIIGATVFMALEAYKEADICTGRRATKSFSIAEYFGYMVAYLCFCVLRTIPILCYLCWGVAFIVCQGSTEEQYDKNITDLRKEVAVRIQNIVTNETLVKSSTDFLTFIERDLEEYEESYQEYLKHVNNSDKRKKTWTFWNSMFYAGTIYTTIGASGSNILVAKVNLHLLVVHLLIDEEGSDENSSSSRASCERAHPGNKSTTTVPFSAAKQ